MEATRSPGAGGSYARKAQFGDTKSNTERKRLLTDRNAYIAYLENQVERSNTALLEVEAAASDLRLLRGRVDDLEEKLHSSGRTLELLQAQSVQMYEASQTDRHDALEQMHRLEGRALRLEQALAEGRNVVEADMSRLRNELSLGVQDLGQRVDDRLRVLKERFDERLHALQAASSDEATVVIREAQATCVRLADDVLGVAEGSQKKVEELAGQVGASQRRLEDLERQTEAGLDTLRAENVAVRAELAGRSARWHEGQSGRAEGSSAPLEPTERRELPAASPTEELADAVERRLTSRLGLQVLQLSEVLQRVVQSQATLTQQLTSGPAGAKAKARSSRSVDGLKPASAACAEPRAASEDRKQAIEELYKELRQLEAEVPSRARRF